MRSARTSMTFLAGVTLAAGDRRRSARGPASLRRRLCSAAEFVAMTAPCATISRLERDGAAVRGRARGHDRGAGSGRQSIVRACRGPRRPCGDRRRARAGGSPGRRACRPMSCSRQARQRPTPPCWPAAGTRFISATPSMTACWPPAKASRARASSKSRSSATAAPQVEAIADDVLCGREPFGPRRWSRCSWPTTRPVSSSRWPRSAAFARAHGIAVHTDAVQAPRPHRRRCRSARRRLLSLSAHKLGGPKGVGAWCCATARRCRR